MSVAPVPARDAPPPASTRVDAGGDIWCARCRRHRAPGEFGRDRTRPLGLTAVCRDCRNATQRERDRLRAAARRPALAGSLATVDEVHRARRSQEAPPRARIERCRHPGLAVWKSDGDALIAELHEAGLCGAIVRGWTATAGEAEALVEPRFERKAAAALFSAMMRHRLGLGPEP